MNHYLFEIVIVITDIKHRMNSKTVNSYYIQVAKRSRQTLTVDATCQNKTKCPYINIGPEMPPF